MESYLRYLFNVVHTATARGHLQPVYGIGLEADLGERSIDTCRVSRHRPGAHR